jgi:DNA-directed RNA polymerase subunit N (RpoN/RPB10)
LCLTCGKTMAENRGKCFDCGAIVTRLIRVQFLSLFDFVDIFFNLL